MIRIFSVVNISWKLLNEAIGSLRWGQISWFLGKFCSYGIKQQLYQVSLFCRKVPESQKYWDYLPYYKLLVRKHIEYIFAWWMYGRAYCHTLFTMLMSQMAYYPCLLNSSERALASRYYSTKRKTVEFQYEIKLAELCIVIRYSPGSFHLYPILW